MAELTREQQVYLVGLAASCIIAITKSVNIHRKESMNRKIITQHRERFNEAINSEMYKNATYAEKKLFLDKFKQMTERS